MNTVKFRNEHFQGGLVSGNIPVQTVVAVPKDKGVLPSFSYNGQVIPTHVVSVLHNKSCQLRAVIPAPDKTVFELDIVTIPIEQSPEIENKVIVDALQKVPITLHFQTISGHTISAPIKIESIFDLEFTGSCEIDVEGQLQFFKVFGEFFPDLYHINLDIVWHGGDISNPDGNFYFNGLYITSKFNIWNLSKGHGGSGTLWLAEPLQGQSTFNNHMVRQNHIKTWRLQIGADYAPKYIVHGIVNPKSEFSTHEAGLSFFGVPTPDITENSVNTANVYDKYEDLMEAKATYSPISGGGKGFGFRNPIYSPYGGVTGGTAIDIDPHIDVYSAGVPDSFWYLANYLEGVLDRTFCILWDSKSTRTSPQDPFNTTEHKVYLGPGGGTIWRKGKDTYGFEAARVKSEENYNHLVATKNVFCPYKAEYLTYANIDLQHWIRQIRELIPLVQWYNDSISKYVLELLFNTLCFSSPLDAELNNVMANPGQGHMGRDYAWFGVHLAIMNQLEGPFDEENINLALAKQTFNWIKIATLGQVPNGMSVVAKKGKAVEIPNNELVKINPSGDTKVYISQTYEQCLFIGALQYMIEAGQYQSPLLNILKKAVIAHFTLYSGPNNPGVDAIVASHASINGKDYVPVMNRQELENAYASSKHAVQLNPKAVAYNDFYTPQIIGIAAHHMGELGLYSEQLIPVIFRNNLLKEIALDVLSGKNSSILANLANRSAYISELQYMLSLSAQEIK